MKREPSITPEDWMMIATLRIEDGMITEIRKDERGIHITVSYLSKFGTN